MWSALPRRDIGLLADWPAHTTHSQPDVTGIPFSVPASRESIALGAALVAGVAARMYPDHRSAIAAAAGPERHFQPDAAAHETCAAGYRSYVEVAER